MSDLQVIAFDAGVKLDPWPSAPAERLLKATVAPATDD